MSKTPNSVEGIAMSNIEELVQLVRPPVLSVDANGPLGRIVYLDFQQRWAAVQHSLLRFAIGVVKNEIPIWGSEQSPLTQSHPSPWQFVPDPPVDERTCPLVHQAVITKDVSQLK